MFFLFFKMINLNLKTINRKSKDLEKQNINS